MNFHEVLINIKAKECTICGEQAQGFKTTDTKIAYYCRDCLYRIPKINSQAYALLSNRSTLQTGLTELPDFGRFSSKNRMGYASISSG